MIKVQIKKLKEDAKIPSYAHEGDAGVDLFASKEYDIRPGETVLVATGISMAIPEGYEGQVRPKSGLAVKFGLSVLNTPGTVDAGYRGEVGVIIINHGKESYRVEKGMKVAQMVFNKVEKAEFLVVKELEESKRGEGGFGSTGLH